MVPVEMGDQNAIDRGGADPRAFHRDQRRGAAVDEEADWTGIDMDARLETAPASEVVSAPQKAEADGSGGVRRVFSGRCRRLYPCANLVHIFAGPCLLYECVQPVYSVGIGQ